MFEIPNFEGLDFDEGRHAYKLNGVELPSVTALMRPLSEEHYAGIDPSVLQRAAERGTAVHNAVENFIKFGVTDIAPEHEGYFEAFKNWYAEHDVKPAVSELRLYHNYFLYAGTADLIAEVDGQDALVDFKTSAAVSRGLCGVQLAAYASALRSHMSEWPLLRRAVVHLKRDGQYEMINFDNYAKYSEVLGALINIDAFKRKMELGLE